MVCFYKQEIFNVDPNHQPQWVRTTTSKIPRSCWIGILGIGIPKKLGHIKLDKASSDNQHAKSLSSHMN